MSKEGTNLKKDINLLPEDLRKKKIKIPKIKIEKKFDFRLSEPEESEKSKAEKIKLSRNKQEEPKEIKDAAGKDKNDKNKLPSAPASSSSSKPYRQKQVPIELSKVEESHPAEKDKEGAVPKSSSEEKEEESKKRILSISKVKLGILPRLQEILSNYFKADFLKPGDKGDKKDKKRPFHLDVNLILKDEELFESEEKKAFKKICIEIVACFITIFIFYFYFLFCQWRIGDEGEKTKAEISKIENQIMTFQSEEKTLLDIQEKVLYVKNLLDGHIYWTKFFALLEKYTLEDVYYVDFKTSAGSDLSLSGVARDSNSLVRQIVSFKNAVDFIDSVEIKDITLAADKEEVSFLVNLVLKEDVFIKNQSTN